MLLWPVKEGHVVLDAGGSRDGDFPDQPILPVLIDEKFSLALLRFPAGFATLAVDTGIPITNYKTDYEKKNYRVMSGLSS
jgi:hypothetical protein